MKCSSCSGVSPEGARFCQFCGNTSFVATPPQEPTAAQAAPVAGSDPAAFFESLVQIKHHPKNPFRWLPFLFNISYLAGYGNTREAGRAIGILMIGYLLAAVFHFLGMWELARLAFYGNAIFGLWYCYMISTRIDSLVRRDKAFNWPVAIGYWLIYVIVSSVLTSKL